MGRILMLRGETERHCEARSMAKTGALADPRRWKRSRSEAAEQRTGQSQHGTALGQADPKLLAAPKRQPRGLGTIGFGACRRDHKAVPDNQSDCPTCQPTAPGQTLRRTRPVPSQPFGSRDEPEIVVRIPAPLALKLDEPSGEAPSKRTLSRIHGIARREVFVLNWIHSPNRNEEMDSLADRVGSACGRRIHRVVKAPGAFQSRTLRRAG